MEVAQGVIQAHCQSLLHTYVYVYNIIHATPHIKWNRGLKLIDVRYYLDLSGDWVDSEMFVVVVDTVVDLSIDTQIFILSSDLYKRVASSYTTSSSLVDGGKDQRVNEPAELVSLEPPSPPRCR